MRLRFLAALLALGALAALAPPAQAELTSVKTTHIASFQQPVYVASAPGFPNLLFVVEQHGVVRVVRNGKKLAKPFLDIRGRVTNSPGYDERGLLSIAFPPNYRKSRRFYVYFNGRKCNRNTDGCDIVVAEFKRSKGKPTRALARSSRRVIRIPHRQAGNHNGGTAMFGPDGKLWLATGDGGGGGDQFDNARKRNNLLGKLLRIDPRKPKPKKIKRGYRIPRTNPFVGKPGRDEIWSIGLRNPFRFSFDTERDAIAIGDVGQNSWEEVNFVSIDDAKGANFGWPEYEGNQVHDAGRPGPGPLIFPVHTYENGAGPGEGVSVVGGVVVRDPRFAGLPGFDPAVGRYIYADHMFGPLRSFDPDAVGLDHHDLPDADPGRPAGFGVDSKGRVFIAARSGGLYRLDPAP